MTSPSSAPAPDSKSDRRAGSTDWGFARQPFWIFSHLFALSVVTLFVILGLWQLSRHSDRQEANTIVAERLDAEPLAVNGSDDLVADPVELDYQPAVVSGVFDHADFARVVNRSQGGVAGEHVVGIVKLADGSLLATNRGFVPANADPELRLTPDEQTTVTGWLRPSVEKGRFGADDSGQGELIPRMNSDDLAARLGQDLPDVWLQIATEAPTGGDSTPQFPDPVPLPELDAGPHLGYTAQWFIFAALGVLFYGALLRRQARAV